MDTAKKKKKILLGNVLKSKGSKLGADHISHCQIVYTRLVPYLPLLNSLYKNGATAATSSTVKEEYCVCFFIL